MRHYPPQQDNETVDEFEDEIERPPSKSQRKRDMQALRDMGEELVALPGSRLKKLEMPENLLAALLEWQRITKVQARGRQMQYIGKLLRDVDLAPLQDALDVVKGISAKDTARMHRLEQWRVRLLEDETVIGEIVAEHPDIDVQHLRTLRRNALKEKELLKPPRAFREIFQILKELDEAKAKLDAEAAIQDSEEDPEEDSD